MIPDAKQKPLRLLGTWRLYRDHTQSLATKTRRGKSHLEEDSHRLLRSHDAAGGVVDDRSKHRSTEMLRLCSNHLASPRCRDADAEAICLKNSVNVFCMCVVGSQAVLCGASIRGSAVHFFQNLKFRKFFSDATRRAGRAEEQSRATHTRVARPLCRLCGWFFTYPTSRL